LIAAGGPNLTCQPNCGAPHLAFAVASSAFLPVLCASAFSFAVAVGVALAFESATCKIISQKQPKTRLSSPRTPLNSHIFNNPNPIRTKKSLPDYPVHFGILKK
jgi:hypothetical protein